MAPASADSCLKTPTAPRENRNATSCFVCLFFSPQSFYFSLFTFSLSAPPQSRNLSGRVLLHKTAFPLRFRSPPGTAPRTGVGVRGCGLQPLHTVNKCADSAAIATILPFQNFLPPLPKYKRGFCAEHGAGAVTGSAQGAMWYLVSLQYMFL